jgi:hypothetical protein
MTNQREPTNRERAQQKWAKLYGSTRAEIEAAVVPDFMLVYDLADALIEVRERGLPGEECWCFRPVQDESQCHEQPCINIRALLERVRGGQQFAKDCPDLLLEICRQMREVGLDDLRGSHERMMDARHEKFIAELTAQHADRP